MWRVRDVTVGFVSAQDMMRRSALFLFSLAILGTHVSCSWTKSAEPQLSGPIGLVRFPEPWLKVIGSRTTILNDNIGYVIRKSPRGELLFAIKQGFAGEQYGKDVSDFPVKSADYDYYSDNQFAVSLDGGFRVRAVDQAEWYAAQKPLHSYHFIMFSGTPEGVEYKGRLYRKSGESWGHATALVSPRGIWIAVFSYSSRDKPDRGMLPGFPAAGDEPGRGEVFLDVYNVSSGEKVISARAPFGRKPGGFVPSMLFGASVWIEDRYLIMPLDWILDHCLVGVLPEPAAR
jgi:hypothetical protein